MNTSEIRLSKAHFKIFNDDDQFAIFDEDGYGEYEDFNKELDKLFEKFDSIIVTKNYYIYGEKNGVREELSDQAFDGYGIALEIVSDAY